MLIRTGFLNREERTENTLYQELQFQEPDALAEIDEGAEITGRNFSSFSSYLNWCCIYL